MLKDGDGDGGEEGVGDAVGSDGVAQNVVAIFHASFHPTKGNTIDWSLTSPTASPTVPSESAGPSEPSPSTASNSIDLSGVEFSVLPSGLHLVERDVVYFTHQPNPSLSSSSSNTNAAHSTSTSQSHSYAGLAVFRRRPTKNKHHRGFRLQSLGILLEESNRPRPWMHLEDLKALADEVYRDADRRERELEDGEDLLGLELGRPGGLGDLTEEDFEPARRWFEERKASSRRGEEARIGRTVTPVDVWSGWSDELDGTYASKATPTHHLPHLLRILGLSSLTLYKFVLSRRRILIYTLPPVEVAGVLAWITADLCREHHMAPRSHQSQSLLFGTPMPSLFNDFSSKTKTKETGGAGAEGEQGQEEDSCVESPTVLGMITLSDIPRLERESATGRGWIACTTDAIFLERPQYYDLVLDLTTSTPSKSSRPSLYMAKCVSSSNAGGAAGPAGGKRKEKWKLESVRFTWSDVKLWTELDRILKLDSSQTSHHGHVHPSAGAGGACCLPKSPLPTGGSGTPGPVQGVWADAFRVYEDVCLLCATLWMGLGTWRSNSRQSFASRDLRDFDYNTPNNQQQRRMTRGWGSAQQPGDEDWSMEGTHMRTLGQGIEGNPALRRKDKDKDKDKERREAKIRAVGLGIEGRPRSSLKAHRSKSQTYAHGLGHGQGHGHARKASGSSTLTASSSMKIPKSVMHVEAVDEDDHEDENQGDSETRRGEEQAEELNEEEYAEEMRRQNVQTTLALLQTFHANTVFWLSRLREVLPPPSIYSTPSFPSPSASSPAGGSRLHGAYTRLRQDEDGTLSREEDDDDEEEEEETLVITARDLLSLELGVLSELDAKFVEWLVEAEGYASPSPSPLPLPLSSASKAAVAGNTRRGVHVHGQRRRRRVVVKRGWQELFGILLGLK